MKFLFSQISNFKRSLSEGRFVFENIEKKDRVTESFVQTDKEKTELKKEVVTEQKKETSVETMRKIKELRLQADKDREKKQEIDKKVKEIRTEIDPQIKNLNKTIEGKYKEILKSKLQTLENLKKSGKEKEFQEEVKKIQNELAEDPDIKKEVEKTQQTADQIKENNKGFFEKAGDVASDLGGAALDIDIKRTLGAAVTFWFAPNFFTDASLKTKAWLAGIGGAIFLNDHIASGVLRGAEWTLENIGWKTIVKNPVDTIFNTATGLATGEIVDEFSKGNIIKGLSYIFPEDWGGGNAKISSQELNERVHSPEFYKKIEEQPEFRKFMPEKFKQFYDKKAALEEKNNDGVKIPFTADDKDKSIDNAAKLFVQSMDHLNLAEMNLNREQLDQMQPTGWVAKMRRNFLSIYNSDMYRYFNEHPDERVRNAFWKKVEEYGQKKDEGKLESFTMDNMFGDTLTPEMVKEQKTGIDRFMFNGTNGNGVQLALWGGMIIYGLSMLAVGGSWIFKEKIPELYGKAKEKLKRGENEIKSTDEFNPKKVKAMIEKGDFRGTMNALQDQNVITEKESGDFLNKWINDKNPSQKQKDFMERLKKDRAFNDILDSKKKTIKDARDVFRKFDGEAEGVLYDQHFMVIDSYNEFRKMVLDNKGQKKKGLSYKFKIENTKDQKGKEEYAFEDILYKNKSKKDAGLEATVKYNDKSFDVKFRMQGGELQFSGINEKDAVGWDWRTVKKVEKSFS
ncbi:hypothetical protein K9L27_04035 [Candidatus Gracilibacteria bacterium]|nr:hypothetical protein [Candidatus Gracilibacteria bacterium]